MLNRTGLTAKAAGLVLLYIHLFLVVAMSKILCYDNYMMKNKKLWEIICILAIIAYTLKNLFIGADTDEGYGIMVGYRLAMGDRLLLEMWEPHQTSAIFTAVFIRLYLLLTGGVNYLNLFLRIVFFPIQAGVSIFLYKTIRKTVPQIDETVAALMGLLYYMTTPKSIFIPEYSNLHNWFFTLMALCLLRYFGSKDSGGRTVAGRLRYLVLAGIFMTCDVLAYPSMVLVFVCCLAFLLVRSSEKKWKELCAYVLPCVAGAAVMFTYLLSYMTPQKMLQMAGEILGEGSHQITMAEKLAGWGKSLGEILLILLGAFLLAEGIRLLTEKLCRKTLPKLLRIPGMLFLILVFLIQAGIWLFSPYNAIYPQLPLASLALAGGYVYLRKDTTENLFFELIVLAFVNYLAVLLLSNWEPAFLNTYLILGAEAGLICLGCWWQKENAWGQEALRILCLCLALGNAFSYTYLILGSQEYHASVLRNVRGMNRVGLRAGILTDYMTAYRYRSNSEVWPEAVPDGSTVLYVGPSQFYCMLGEHTQASPDTICSMVYDERLLDYWETNPDRYPDVVVFESCYGDIAQEGEDSFIWNWLMQEFQPAERKDYPYITVFTR